MIVRYPFTADADAVAFCNQCEIYHAEGQHPSPARLRALHDPIIEEAQRVLDMVAEATRRRAREDDDL